MAAHSHSRTGPDESGHFGSSYRLILAHVLQYPGSYEIPLRTMYTLNVAQRAQHLPPRSASSHKSSGSSDSTNSTHPPAAAAAENNAASAASAASAATAQFGSNLMSHLSQLPSQPCSLPPSFISSFVRRCFHPQLTAVDFPQALTALDYLKDLETRRRKEMQDAFKRLNIQPATMESDIERASEHYPAVAQWVRKMLEKARKVENMYSHIYVGLRRWMLINEMSLAPFNKHNCVAMLNTLYPPIQSSSPTSLLTPDLLEKQRDGFFRYIQSVERNGAKVLKTLIEQGKKGDDPTGWGAVQDALDKYLCTAKYMIDDCLTMMPAEPLAMPVVPKDSSKRKGRKVDSGVSFGTEKRPSTSHSASSSSEAKPLPILAAPSAPSPSQTPVQDASGKGGSTLEKITREFRRLRLKPRASHADLRQETAVSQESPIIEAQRETKSRNTLKKMRSLGALTSVKHRNGSSISLHGQQGRGDIPDFDADMMKKQRMRYEASQAK